MFKLCRLSMGKLRTKEDILAEIHSVHGDLYDYSKFEYINTDTHAIIICKIHGEFKQTPYHHIKRKQGCPKCGAEKCKVSKKLNNIAKRTVLEQPEDYKVVMCSRGSLIKVSNCDYDKVKDIIWTSSRGYLHNSAYGSLHRFILDAPKDMVVDHISRDISDNRRENLRICNHRENLLNSKSERGISSYKGVQFNKRHNKWTASITFMGKTFRIGTFTDEIEAAKAYDKKAKELFGEFAYLNFPDDV